MATGMTAPMNLPLAAPADSLPESLAAVLDELWRRIAGGCNERWPPWGLPTLATLGPEGPRARILALREVDARHRRFTFHTDGRSEKLRELAYDPRVSITFWDPSDAIQARFSGIAEVHRGDEIARSAWSRVSPLRRMGSAMRAAPGSALARTQRFESLPADGDEESAFRNFALVVIEAASIDWLWLGREDLRRAFFRWTGTEWSASWVVP